MEFPWELGPANGRYLLRWLAGPDRGEPERVIVLGTVAAGVQDQPAPFGGRLGRRRARAHTRPTGSQPATVAVTRATAIEAKPLAGADRASAWLRELDPEREADAGVRALNRLLYAHRVAAAAPYLNEVSAEQATIVRAGYGEGEQVADGRWTDARELVLSRERGSRRAAVLRPQERLALLLSGRERTLLCEELTLRARADLDAGRLALAAICLDRAYAAALAELPDARHGLTGTGTLTGTGAFAGTGGDMRARVEELTRLSAGVEDAAGAALSAAEQSAGGASASADDEIDQEGLRAALERLEAALRARAAAGFSLQQ